MADSNLAQDTRATIEAQIIELRNEMGRLSKSLQARASDAADDAEDAFESVWLNRDSQLNKVPGFVEFHLLKGPEAEDHTLYASHTVWQSKATFEAWTKSEAFRVAHARAGNETTGPLYLEHPKFEGFEVRQTLQRLEAAVA